MENKNEPTDIDLSSFSYIFNDEISMQQAIYSVGPIFVFLSSQLLSNYTGGIINSTTCSKETDHVVLAVGLMYKLDKYSQCGGTEYNGSTI